MKSLKKTTFLEAVAAAIKHEVKSFNFFIKLSNDLPEGETKGLFEQLAEDGDKHIEFIKEIYAQAEGKELPNLKTLSEIHKFHTTTIQKLMDRLERNMNQDVGSNERKALELAVLHGDDAKKFYGKLKDKFPDPKINLLFSRLQDFIDMNTNLLEAQIMTMEQATPIERQYFWEDRALMDEAASTRPPAKKASAKKKSQASQPPKPTQSGRSALSAKPVAKKSSGKPTGKPANKSTPQAGPKSTKKVTPKPSAKSVKKSISHASAKSAKKSAAKPVAKPTQKSTPKPKATSVKKPNPKTVAKKKKK